MIDLIKTSFPPSDNHHDDSFCNMFFKNAKTSHFEPLIPSSVLIPVDHLSHNQPRSTTGLVTTTARLTAPAASKFSHMC